LSGWTHHLLDIDERVRPDVLGDARELASLVPAGTYDAVYCSHNIEHYYPHDVPKVLRGFLHASEAGRLRRDTLPGCWRRHARPHREEHGH
jgi:hypothetical protein